jgi:hypothetical protein
VTYDLRQGEGAPGEELRAQRVHGERERPGRKPAPARHGADLVGRLKQIGITLKIEQLEQTTLIQMRNAEKYSIYNAAWTNDTRIRRAPGRRAGLLVAARGPHLLQQPEGKELLLQQRASSTRRSARCW